MNCQLCSPDLHDLVAGKDVEYRSRDIVVVPVISKVMPHDKTAVADKLQGRASVACAGCVMVCSIDEDKVNAAEVR